MVVGVVAAGNGVAEARVLARSLELHHPDWPMTVLVAPGLRPELRPGSEPFEVLLPLDLDVPGLDQMLRAAPPPALAALLRPLLAAHLLERGEVLILAPDAELHAPLELPAEGDAVLVPRVTGVLPDDGRRPDGRDLLEAGEIDDAFVLVRDRRFVEWWTDRAREAATVASPLGAARRVFPNLALLDDPGCDVSYWNLHERPLGRDGAELTAGGRPLRLMRWAGFRPDRPWWLSEHASRTIVLDDPILTELCARRAQALYAAGWQRLDQLVGADELATGIRYDARVQRLHAEAQDAGEDFGDVFSPGGAEALTQWLTEPAPHGAAAGVNRYAYDAWKERADVQAAYPDLDGADAEGFLGWLWVHGRPELRLQSALLQPPPPWIEETETRVPPVQVTGYLRGNLGLGQAARAYISALVAAHVPVATRSVAVDPPVERLPRRARPRPEERAHEELRLPESLAPEIDLVCVNADQLPAFSEAAGEDFGKRYTIAHWAWETDVVPDVWLPAFEMVDELWVISTFIAENLSRIGSLPVIVVPLPVEKPDVEDARSPIELGDAFTFLFAFDFFSTMQRKNPLGVVEAFKTAFAPGEGPLLLLKTINADFRPQERERLRYAIGDRPDIRMVDAALAPGELDALFARADCYVSLHRAEGFGLTLAESMALGKPVIATGYSGNTDFMTPANSYLVDWTLTEVGPDAEHYPAAGHWAEPSIEHAAALMREVYGDRDAAAGRGARAAADVAATLSPSAVGHIARERLLTIARRRAQQPAADHGAPHPDLPARLRFDLGGGGARGGARRAARRAVLRAMRPYTVPERALDEAMAESLRRLNVELEAERAAAARSRQHVARLAARTEALERALTERSTGPLQDLLTAARAIPFMAEPPAEFDHPIAGRVLGYRDGAAVAGEQAYRSFEDVFRGSAERVRGLMEPYVELLRGHEPVLDVGCGRGELLTLLREAGIAASGVDSDAGMAERAREQGLAVVVADGAEHLAALRAGSLGAVTAMQVIEHLPYATLLALFAAARRALRPGGLFVAETVNPHAAHALKTFWVDPTHRHPLFPEVTLVLARDAGFSEAFVCHLAGERDVRRDRFAQSSYALVATA